MYIRIAIMENIVYSKLCITCTSQRIKFFKRTTLTLPVDPFFEDVAGLPTLIYLLPCNQIKS